MRRVLAAHREIALVLVIFVALGKLYSVTTPLFEAPDEQWHYAYVQYVAQGNGLPVQTVDKPLHLARQEGSQPPLYYLLAAGLTFWIDTSDYPGIIWENPHYGYNVPGIVNDNKNLFIHTSRESFPYQGVVLAIHLARLLAVLMGALAALFTYFLALELFSNKNIAAASAAIAAFIPQFVFVSGAVSNDSTIVAMTALALWLVVRATVRAGHGENPGTREMLTLGVAAGLAALAKVSGAGIVIVAGAALIYIYRKDGRRLALSLGVFGASAFVIAGWWYLRNWYLYGDLTGTAMMSRIFGARAAWLSLAELVTQLGEVWETFWVGFGWGNIRALPAVYQIIAGVVLIGCAGVLVGLWRKRVSDHPQKVGSAILGLWVAIVLVEMLNWMETTQAPHGRLVFPVLPALGPLLLFGLVQWLPGRAPGWLARVPGLALAVFAFLALFGILQPAYAYPVQLSASDLGQISSRVDLIFADKIKLLGFEIDPRNVQLGNSAMLSLYWHVLDRMSEDYTIGIHLLDAQGKIVGGRDSYPGHGLVPTTLLQPGQIIRDVYWVPIAPSSSPGVATVQVDLYTRGDKQTLPAFDAKGQAVTPFIGRFKVAGSSPVTQPRTTLHAIFGNQIELTGYDVDTGENGGTRNLVLYWKRTKPIAEDYTVFVHLLDKDGNKVAQQDRQPAQGTNPTSMWLEGEQVVDAYTFEWDERAAQVVAGLYHGDSGERLTVRDNKGNESGDHIVIQLPGGGR